MITLNEQMKKEYVNDPREGFEILDSERQRKEIIHSEAAWMRAAVRRGKGLSQKEEMSINI